MPDDQVIEEKYRVTFPGGRPCQWCLEWEGDPVALHSECAKAMADAVVMVPGK